MSDMSYMNDWATERLAKLVQSLREDPCWASPEAPSPSKRVRPVLDGALLVSLDASEPSAVEGRGKKPKKTSTGSSTTSSSSGGGSSGTSSTTSSSGGGSSSSNRASSSSGLAVHTLRGHGSPVKSPRMLAAAGAERMAARFCIAES